jgi:hypothetical protein
MMVGCFLSPVPDVRTPADRARELEPKCSGVSDGFAESLLSPDVVDVVAASYSHVPGGPNGTQTRFSGAVLHVRPIAGASRESITRALECHQARVVLGRAPRPEDDPYTLPERWLSIDVESEGDGFAVRVRADDIADARHVLARAKAFASRRGHSRAASDASPPPASTIGQAKPLQ